MNRFTFHTSACRLASHLALPGEGWGGGFLFGRCWKGKLWRVIKESSILPRLPAVRVLVVVGAVGWKGGGAVCVYACVPGYH